VTKSFNHTLCLHRLISNSSSAINFPWLSYTENSHSRTLLYSSVLLVLFYSPTAERSTRLSSAQLNSATELNSQLLFVSRYIDLGWTSRKTQHVSECMFIGRLRSTGLGADHIENTFRSCTRYSASSCLPSICLRGNVFVEPLASSGSIRHIIYMHEWENTSSWCIGKASGRTFTWSIFIRDKGVSL
jgi:hypothetical protein